MVARRAATEQAFRGIRAGEADEEGRGHDTPRVRPEAPCARHVVGAREADVCREDARPGMDSAADQARRGAYLRPDDGLLPSTSGRVHLADPRPVGGTDG